MARPLCAIAQSSAPVRRIGVFFGVAASDPQRQSRFGALRNGLQDLRWTEGHNVRFELRHAVGNSDRFPIMVAMAGE